MKHPEYIIFEVDGKFFVSFPEIEQIIKRALFRDYKPDSIVICRDFDTDEILDECELQDLFNQ